MAGVYGEINSRVDFFGVLDDAIREGKALLAKNVGDATLEVIVRQLEAVRSWTANGRIPTAQERDSIDFALRASREFEGDREKYRWTRSLYSLDSYFSDWPSDEQAANATDDDFFDGDEDE